MSSIEQDCVGKSIYESNISPTIDFDSSSNLNSGISVFSDFNSSRYTTTSLSVCQSSNNSPTTSSLTLHVPEASQKKEKHVTFGLVDLYHFSRLQGFTCVPSQGGSTLGMSSVHFIKECFPVMEHQSRRKLQRHSTLLRFCLEGKLLLSFHQFQMLESRVERHRQFLEQLIKDGRSGTNSQNFKLSLESYERCCDEDLSFLNNLEEYYFLQPLPVKRRRIMLRKAGLSSIDPSEKYECAAIRKSRTECGCTCASGLCDPQSCECALNGIPCQVDRESFPCACLSPGHCSNPEGRVEFNPVRVRTHYLHTRMRIDEEEREETTATPVPVKRFCPIEVPLYSDLVSNAICFSHKSELSLSSLKPGKPTHSRTVDEALNATTSNGGCRDCQDQRYVHFMQQLQSPKCQQNNFEIEMGVEEDEEEEVGGESCVLNEISLLPGNHAEAFGDAKVAACDQCNFYQHNSQTHPISKTVNGALMHAVFPGSVDSSLSCEGDSSKSTSCAAHLPSTSAASCSNSPDSVSSTFCILEPITSLFHSSSQGVSISNTQEMNTKKTSVPPSRPPSVCEVATA